MICDTFYSETEYAYRLREDFHRAKPNLYDHLYNFCKKVGIKKTDLTTDARTNWHVRHRAMFCGYMYRGENKPTLKEIGNLLGGRDHSTILHSLELHYEFMQDKKYSDIFNRVLHCLSNANQETN